MSSVRAMQKNPLVIFWLHETIGCLAWSGHNVWKEPTHTSNYPKSTKLGNSHTCSFQIKFKPTWYLVDVLSLGHWSAYVTSDSPSFIQHTEICRKGEMYRGQSKGKLTYKTNLILTGFSVWLCCRDSWRRWDLFALSILAISTIQENIWKSLTCLTELVIKCETQIFLNRSQFYIFMWFNYLDFGMY